MLLGVRSRNARPRIEVQRNCWPALGTLRSKLEALRPEPDQLELYLQAEPLSPTPSTSRPRGLNGSSRVLGLGLEFTVLGLGSLGFWV